MTYYIARQVEGTFEEAIVHVTEALKAEGFGVLTEIDVAKTLKTKLDKDFRPYRILGACNPSLAFQALSAEDKVGVMLPCNVIVQSLPTGASRSPRSIPRRRWKRSATPRSHLSRLRCAKNFSARLLALMPGRGPLRDGQCDMASGACATDRCAQPWKGGATL